MKQVTDRQEAVLMAIHTSIAKRGYPPTIREIAGVLGIRWTNGVNDHLTRLRAKGMLEDGSYMTSRGLRLTPRGQEHAERLSPLRGPAAASMEVVDVPIYDSVHPDDPKKITQTLRFSRKHVGSGVDLYGFEIVPEMITKSRTGFLPGDIVIVDPDIATPKKIVVTCIDLVVELRRLVPKDDDTAVWRLEDVLNDDVMEIAKNELSSTMILGTMVAMWRQT